MKRLAGWADAYSLADGAAQRLRAGRDDGEPALRDRDAELQGARALQRFRRRLGAHARRPLAAWSRPTAASACRTRPGLGPVAQSRGLCRPSADGRPDHACSKTVGSSAASARPEFRDRDHRSRSEGRRACQDSSSSTSTSRSAPCARSRRQLCRALGETHALDGRERRRQVHAPQDSRRHRHARRRRDPAGRSAAGAVGPARRARARHRDGLSGDGDVSEPHRQPATSSPAAS